MFSVGVKAQSGAEITPVLVMMSIGSAAKVMPKEEEYYYLIYRHDEDSSWRGYRRVNRCFVMVGLELDENEGREKWESLRLFRGGQVGGDVAVGDIGSVGQAIAGDDL